MKAAKIFHYFLRAFAIVVLLTLNIFGLRSYDSLTRNFGTQFYGFPMPIFEQEIHFLDKDRDQIIYFRRAESFDGLRSVPNGILAGFVDTIIIFATLYLCAKSQNMNSKPNSRGS